MPRPRVSEENLALAMEFARMVTTDCGCNDASIVARHGPCSIYAVLEQCHPSIIRRGEGAETTNRKGISEAEMLRALSESGVFERFRDRKAVKMASDPTGAGMCVFKNLRWRDPSLPADLKFLREQHKRLARKHSAFAAETTLDVVVSKLRKTILAWNAARSPEHASSPRSSATVLRPEQGGDANESTPGRTGKRLREDKRANGENVSKSARSKAPSPSLATHGETRQRAARPKDASGFGACRSRENVGTQSLRRTASQGEGGAALTASGRGTDLKRRGSGPRPRSSTRLAHSEAHQTRASLSSGATCAALGGSSAGRDAQSDRLGQVAHSQPSADAGTCSWEQSQAYAKTDEWSRTESAGQRSVNGDGEGVLWEMLPLDEVDIGQVGLQAELVPPTAILPPDPRTELEREPSGNGGVQKRAVERRRDVQAPASYDTALGVSFEEVLQALIRAEQAHQCLREL